METLESKSNEIQEAWKEPEAATPTETKRIQSTTSPIIDGANAAAERLKQENDRKDALLTREAELMAQRQLGGFAAAGERIKEKSQDDLDQEEANSMLKEFI